MRIKRSNYILSLTLVFISLSIACIARSINSQKANEASQLPARSADATSAPAGWKRYSLNDASSVSLILPSEPEHLSYDSGTAEKTHVYISKNDSGVYGVAYLADLPAAARISEESGNEFFFNIFIKPFAVSFKKAIQSNDNDLPHQMLGHKQARVSGFDGMEQDFSLGTFQGRALLFRVNQAGICVVTIWKQPAAPNDITYFFSSVRVENGQ
jgi:hypothetical protein